MGLARNSQKKTRILKRIMRVTKHVGIALVALIALFALIALIALVALVALIALFALIALIAMIAMIAMVAMIALVYKMPSQLNQRPIKLLCLKLKTFMPN